MTASATAYIARGLPPRAASVLATQIEGTSTGKTGELMSAGFSYPLAAELTRQMVAGVGTRSNLMALGMPPLLADLVSTDIEATSSE